MPRGYFTFISPKVDNTECSVSTEYLERRDGLILPGLFLGVLNIRIRALITLQKGHSCLENCQLQIYILVKKPP